MTIDNRNRVGGDTHREETKTNKGTHTSAVQREQRTNTQSHHCTMSSSSSSPPTSNPTNEILWWPPPSCRPVTTTTPGGEEEEPLLDLFACIHAPGSDENDIYVTRNGLLEIHPSKVVFDSTRLYPSCSRQVQKRIVADLQECHAQTSGGRELAVKEWADESQNRGILRLRLRCKKAKCRLQFQVNWETQKNHWFITRQCQNLVHTCPLPSSTTTNTKAAKEGRKKTTTSTNGTKKRAAPTNGTHDSFGSNHNNNPAPLTETAPSTMLLSPPVPPATPAAPVGIPTGVHVVPMNSAATNPVAAVPPTTTPLLPIPGGGVPQPLQPGLAAVAPSTTTTALTAAPIATTVPLVVVTDADRAEAELLATDLQGWVPPPPTATLPVPTTTTTQPLPQHPQQSLPQPSFMGTTTTTTMTDPVVLQQHPPGPASPAPLQTLSIPSPHHHHPHHPQSTVMEQQVPMAQPVSSSNTMAPPPTTSIHIPHTIVSTTTGTATTTATTPPHHHQEQVEYLQPLQAPSSPLSSPSRYHHPSTTAATINEYEQSAAGMSIGANSTAMMSLDDQEDELKDDPAAGGASGETDGMSVLSESESNMLTLGSVSSKYWMNGLPQIPHANLSRLTSDHYNSIGSWFVDGNPFTTTTTSSKHSLNRRPQPVSSSSSHPMAMAAPPPAIPLASTTTSTTSITQAPTTTIGMSQQQQQQQHQQHRDSLYSANATNSTNNFSINDLTMTSLTDSVRNMLSIVGNHEGGSLSGLMGSGWTRSGSVSQPAAPPEGQQVQVPQQQQDAVTLAEAKSSDPSPRMGILAADFYTPPPTSTGTNTSLHPPPPPSS